MNIGNAIYYLLANNSALAEQVGTKIYPIETPQAVKMPVVIYSISGISPTTSKDNSSKLDIYSVEISTFSNNYDEAIDISELVRTALDRQKGEVSGIEIDQINFKNLSVEYIDSSLIHQVSQNYEIRVKR